MQVSLSRIPESGIQTNTEQNAETAKNERHGETYIIKKGDTLWNLAQQYYGDPTKCTAIYEANKEEIERAAKKNGKSGSNGGYWIFPGQSIKIP